MMPKITVSYLSVELKVMEFTEKEYWNRSSVVVVVLFWVLLFVLFLISL